MISYRSEGMNRFTGGQNCRIRGFLLLRPNKNGRSRVHRIFDDFLTQGFARQMGFRQIGFLTFQRIVSKLAVLDRHAIGPRILCLAKTANAPHKTLSTTSILDFGTAILLKCAQRGAGRRVCLFGFELGPARLFLGDRLEQLGTEISFKNLLFTIDSS